MPFQNPLAFSKTRPAGGASAVRPRYENFWAVRHQIHNGDLLLFRRRGLISIAGRSEYSHAAMAGWWDDHLMCLEMREWHGGRAVTLASQAARFAGQIDVYRVAASDEEREAAFEVMRGECGRAYNYLGILLAACAHLPVVRLATHVDTRDELEPGEQFLPRYCSESIAYSWLHGADIDLVPHLAGRMTEPGDLARSERVQSGRVTGDAAGRVTGGGYQFTLTV